MQKVAMSGKMQVSADKLLELIIYGLEHGNVAASLALAKDALASYRENEKKGESGEPASERPRHR